MKKFKPLYTFASLWKQFVMFTKNWRRKPTGELVNKDKLEVEDITATVINGEENPSVKPVYCHPINFQYSTSGGRVYFISCLIFNNDSTPFTSDSWFDYVMGLITDYGAIIMASGAVWSGTKALVATNISDNGSGGMAIRGLLDGTTDFYSITKPDLRDGTFTDGVNKIN